MVQVANATDLTIFQVTPPASQGPDWAGFYFKNNTGSSIGGVPWTSVGTTSGFASSAAAPRPGNENFGYNVQQGNFVFGLEGSLAAANFDGRFTSPYMPLAAGWSPNMNWLGTVTGKVGFSFGQWLPYVKGGFASANVGSALQTNPMIGFSQSSIERNGWTAGVGLEYQLSPKWSLGLEYLYTDLGDGSNNGLQNSLGGAPIAGSPEMYSTALKSQSLLGRLNYKAGW